MMEGLGLRIGLHPTNLTRALCRGDFAEAERLILEATDPDYLNEGALDCTPLSIVLGGSEHHTRNLKLARLLLECGASPNLRIPAPDMETASQSPLELLLAYYLKLINMFGVPGGPSCRTSNRYDSSEETDLRDSVGINGELAGLGPHILTAQTRELLMYCLERGGDPNLPTTDAFKTIYHVAVVAPTIDEGLLQRMLELGANVNHADVHNTTPLMDVISLGDEKRAFSELARLERSGRTPVWDSQNCSLQSVLWRAMFQGYSRLATFLLNIGAAPALAARIESAPGRPPVHLPRPLAADIKIPPLLAPFLNDSPCATGLHANVLKQKYATGCLPANGQFPSSAGRRLGGRGPSAHLEYNVSRMDHLSLTCVAPLVDSSSGLMGEAEVGRQLSELVKLTTDQGRVGEADLSDVVDERAIVPLMFGQVSAGLRQLAVRAILRHALFPHWRSPNETVNLLNEICERRGFTTFRMLVQPSFFSVTGSVLAHDYILELGHEMELSLTQEPVPDMGSGQQLSRDLDSASQQQDPDHQQDLVMGPTSQLVQRSPDHQSVSEEEAEPGSQTVPADDDDQPTAGASASAGGVDTEEFWQGLERLDRDAWGLQTDCFLASLDRESADLERRFWNLALDVLSGLRVDETRTGERCVASQFWDSDQRRIFQLRERMRAHFTEMERQQKALDTVNMELQMMGQELQTLENLEKEAGAANAAADDGEWLEEEEEEELPDQAVPCVEALLAFREQPGGELSVMRQQARKQLDENWSLGPGRELATGPSEDPPVSESKAISHTEMLVQSLDVSMNMAPVQPSSWRTHAESSLVLRRYSATDSRAGSPPEVACRPLPSGEEATFVIEDKKTEDLSTVEGVAGEDDDSFLKFLHAPVGGLARRLRRDSLRHLRHGTDTQDEEEDIVLSALDTSGEEVALPSQAVQQLPAQPEQERNSRTGSPALGDPLSTSSSSLSDSGSWGGPFSLRHVGRCQQDSLQDVPINEATVISRLNPRVLDALTDQLGIPSSLRVCFALEVARLQLTLLLFGRQSITCDRNCEGDESDGDSEDEWADSISDDLASHSDEDADPSSDSDSSSSLSDIGTALSSASSAHSRLSAVSAVSIFGSSQGEAAFMEEAAGAAAPFRAWEASTPTTDLSPVDLSPVSTRRSSGSAPSQPVGAVRCPSSLFNFPPRSRHSSTTSSASSPVFGLSSSPTWLSDREDFRRMRQFLSGPVPPRWQDSTSSGEEEEEKEGGHTTPPPSH